MIEHAYVQHPVFTTRDQCEHKFDDDGRSGFCGRPRSEHMDAERALKVQLATALRDLAGTQEALLALRVDYQREKARADAAEQKLNTPELHDFAKGVVLEAAHQRERWGTDHDGGKTPADWFWLIGYLAGKALHCHAEGRNDKALHHTITAASAMANWHAAILGKTNMRPGIEPPAAAPDPLRWEAVDMFGATASAACHEVHDDHGEIVALCFQQEDAEQIAALHNATLEPKR